MGKKTPCVRLAIVSLSLESVHPAAEDPATGQSRPEPEAEGGQGPL